MKLGFITSTILLLLAARPMFAAPLLGAPQPTTVIIDDFTDPDPVTYAILKGPTNNPNPFFYQNLAASGLILGGQRDVQVKVYKNLTFNSAVVATGTLGGKGTLGVGVNALSKAQVILQYDGVDGSIANAQGLSQVDLTTGGKTNAFRMAIDQWESTTAPAINVVIDVTSPDGSATATRSIPTTDNVAGFNVDVPFGDFTTTAGFLFSKATSLQFTINPSTLEPCAGATDIRLDALELVDLRAVPEPATLAIWSVLGALGAVWAWRRSR